jgi:hypothetical protein
VELVCIQPNAPLVLKLAERPEWRLLYRDAFAVVYERSLSATAVKVDR